MAYHVRRYFFTHKNRERERVETITNASLNARDEQSVSV